MPVHLAPIPTRRGVAYKTSDRSARAQEKGGADFSFGPDANYLVYPTYIVAAIAGPPGRADRDRLLTSQPGDPGGYRPGINALNRKSRSKKAMGPKSILRARFVS